MFTLKGWDPILALELLLLLTKHPHHADGPLPMTMATAWTAEKVTLSTKRPPERLTLVIRVPS